MSLVRVWTDVGQRKPVPLLAKIIERNGVIFTIKYLTEGAGGVWSYEDDTYDVDDESISEYLNNETEDSMGFMKIGDNEFTKESSDDDYVPSDESASDEEDEEDEEEDADDDFSDDTLEESDAESEESLSEE
jgi:hypothetical protein